MTTFEALADSIKVSFVCPQCGKTVEYEIEDLPIPDYGAETAADSESYDSEDFQCQNCGHEFRADKFVSFYEGNVEIDDLQTGEEIDEVKVEEHFDEQL